MRSARIESEWRPSSSLMATVPSSLIELNNTPETHSPFDCRLYSMRAPGFRCENDCRGDAGVATSRRETRAGSARSRIGVKVLPGGSNPRRSVPSALQRSTTAGSRELCVTL